MGYREIKAYIDNLNIKNDNHIIEYLKNPPSNLTEVEIEEYNQILIWKFNSDALKMQYMEMLKTDKGKYGVILRLKNETDQVKCLDKIKDENILADAASRLTKIENKVRYISKIKDDVLKYFILKTISNSDEEKESVLQLIDDEETKAYVISSMLKDENKIRLIEDIQDENNKVIIIVTFNDDKKKLAFLDENMHSENKTLIIASLNADNKKKELLGLDSNITSEIILPKDMTIGIEIECEGIKSGYINNMGNVMKNWNAKIDTSLEHGVEIVSPILINTQENNKNIHCICKILKDIGQSVSERCGGHVHIGADYLKTTKGYANLLELWSNNEKIIYDICNEKNDPIREDIIRYAPPISKELESFFENEELIEITNKKDFIEKLKKSQEGKRHLGLSFYNIGDASKNTIEFRIANGTLNPDTWIQNINLFGGIIEAAQRISEIQQKNITERTENENIQLENFNKLRNMEISEQERLQILLSLCVHKKQANIYIERYETNKIGIDRKEEFREKMQKKIAEKKLVFSTLEITKACYIGKNAVNGVGVQNTQSIINEDIKKMINQKEGQEI